MIGTETVTRLRAATAVDPYSGDPAEDWTIPTSVTFTRCLVWAGGSVEPRSADRQAVEVDIRVALPAGADVTARDRLIVRGKTYQVVGEPFDWRMGGYQPGTVAGANRVEG